MQAFRTLQSRFSFWAEQAPLLNLVTIVLGWFTITVEVFLRRDFGERYFNRSKVMSGFFLLAFWTVLSKIGSFFQRQSFSFPGMEPEPKTSSFSLGFFVTVLILLLYGFACGYHWFTIWWRNGANRPLHSWDAGKSWLIPVGEIFMVLANMIVAVFFRLYAFSLPSDERTRLRQSPPPAVSDAALFTEKWMEPLTIFILSLVFMALGLGFLGSWLFVSTFALLFFTSLRHEQEREAFLNMRDKWIENTESAKAVMGESDTLRLKSNVTQVVKQIAAQAGESPEMLEQLRQETPSLASAMEALSPKLKNMSSDKSST